MMSLFITFSMLLGAIVGAYFLHKWAVHPAYIATFCTIIGFWAGMVATAFRSAA